MITLNISNSMKDIIGDKGLSKVKIESLEKKLKKFFKEIKQRKWKELLFLDLPVQDITDVKKIASKIKKEAEYFLLLGIGGSALGPKAIFEALSPMHNFEKKPMVFIYDNVDPVIFNKIIKTIQMDKTFINVITKSGSTAETVASFMVLWEIMHKIIGNGTKEHFVITTDPEKGNLKKIAQKNKLTCLSIPPEIVGRYSVLSPVGILLTEIIGINSEEILKGALDIREKIMIEENIWKNPALLMSCILYIYATEYNKIINVIIPYSDRLKAFSEWFCQIWAESLGKQGKGFTPYPSVGVTDQHSQLQLWIDGPKDKIIIFVKIEEYEEDIKIPFVFEERQELNYLAGHTFSELIKAEEESTEVTLTKAGIPNLTIKIPKISAYYMGQLFMFFEIVTVLTGFLIGINPFNQPAVEECKKFIYSIMGKKEYKEKRKEIEYFRNRKKCWEI